MVSGYILLGVSLLPFVDTVVLFSVLKDHAIFLGSLYDDGAYDSSTI